MSKPKLTYFDSPSSRGEECRLALHVAGVDFEDVRIESAEWPALKPKPPFGSLPTLEMPGHPILAQSNAILALIGRLHGLHPKDAFEAARHEAMLCHVEDLRAGGDRIRELRADGGELRGGPEERAGQGREAGPVRVALEHPGGDPGHHVERERRQQERGEAGPQQAVGKLAAGDPRLAGATIYSTLEPCSERKSRPRTCTQLIIASGIRRVVIAWREPGLFVADCQGAELLTQAGLDVAEMPSFAAQAAAPNRHRRASPLAL